MTSYLVYEAGLPLMAGCNHSQEYFGQNLCFRAASVCTLHSACFRALAPLNICVLPPRKACPPVKNHYFKGYLLLVFHFIVLVLKVDEINLNLCKGNQSFAEKTENEKSNILITRNTKKKTM